MSLWTPREHATARPGREQLKASEPAHPATSTLFSFQTCGMPSVSRSMLTQKTHEQNGVRKMDTDYLLRRQTGSSYGAPKSEGITFPERGLQATSAYQMSPRCHSQHRGPAILERLARFGLINEWH